MMFNLDRLETLSNRFDEIEAELANPGGAFDQVRFTALVKERAAIEETVRAYRDYRDVLQQIEANDELLGDRSDPELRELAEEEAQTLREARKTLEDELAVLMLPQDPNDGKDVFIEIRAGAGGDEASLFAAELARMYMRYAESMGMSVEAASRRARARPAATRRSSFGIREGEPYRYFKYESGVHRVQRVPVTEAQGRMHTTTATVAVLPEAEDVEVEINPKDLQIDTYKASRRRRPARQQDRVRDSHHARSERRRR